MCSAQLVMTEIVLDFFHTRQNAQ